MYKGLLEVFEATWLFNKLGKQDVTTTPRWISEKDVHKQVQLIKEEVEEIEQAFRDKDMIEVVDGIVDTLYVLSGLVNRFGVQEEVSKAFEVIHHNNMSKLRDEKGNDISVLKEMVDSEGRKYTKIGKPEGYKPVNLRKFFPYLDLLEQEDEEK